MRTSLHVESEEAHDAVFPAWYRRLHRDLSLLFEEDGPIPFSTATYTPTHVDAQTPYLCMERQRLMHASYVSEARLIAWLVAPHLHAWRHYQQAMAHVYLDACARAPQHASEEEEDTALTLEAHTAIVLLGDIQLFRRSFLIHATRQLGVMTVASPGYTALLALFDVAHDVDSARQFALVAGLRGGVTSAQLLALHEDLLHRAPAHSMIIHDKVGALIWLLERVARGAMDIDWMTRDELREAIPPAYSEFVALQIVPLLIRRLPVPTHHQVLNPLGV